MTGVRHAGGKGITSCRCLSPPLLHYLRVARHVHTSSQELIEVLTELAGGLRQVLSGAARGLHQLIGRLVEASRCLVEVTLSLLETLPAGWELGR